MASRAFTARVEDDLFQLPAIGLDRRQVGPEGQHDLHVFPDEPSQQGLHAGHNLIQVEQRRFNDLLAAERQELAREPRGTQTCLLN